MTRMLVLTLPCASTSPGVARRELRRAVVGHCSESVIIDVTLVVSELVTNAVRHAASECRLVVDLATGTLTIEVHDSGAWPRRTSLDRADSPRGLGLVQSLSERWGVERNAGGKCVWAEFSLLRPPVLQDHVKRAAGSVDEVHAG